MNLNLILGLILFVLGGLMMLIGVVAFVKVQFFTGDTRSLKDLKETLAEANLLLKNWRQLLLVLPKPFRSVFWMLTLGGILIAAGLYLLIDKPIH
jgi:hypothetical protein